MAPAYDRLRQLRQRSRRLKPRVGQWMEEQHNLVEDEALRYFVLLAERFDQLQAIPFMCEVEGDDALLPSPSEVRATLIVAGLGAAADKIAPYEDWDPPFPLVDAVLRVMDSAFPRHAGVDPPQLVAGLFLGWRPRRVPVPELSWEPGLLLVKSMVYKCVHGGLHRLAELGVVPLTTERCHDHAAFARRVAEATDMISLSLIPPQDDRGRSALADWNCQKPLWQVLANLVEGPGPKGKRPQAGAYDSILLGRWGIDNLGVIVGTVLRYACPGCGKLRVEPCQDCPGRTPILTARRHQFLTRRESLTGDDVKLGYEEVCCFKRCHNLDCERTLETLTGVRGLWPIYSEPTCPRCNSRTRRTVTVWARRP